MLININQHFERNEHLNPDQEPPFDNLGVVVEYEDEIEIEQQNRPR